MMLRAFKRNPENIEWMHHEMKTQERCDDAFKRGCTIIEYFPKRCVRPEMCVNFDSFHFFPGQFITKEMCEKAVEHDAENIRAVPEKFRTRELCEKAAENHNVKKWISHYMVEESEQECERPLPEPLHEEKKE